MAEPHKSAWIRDAIGELRAAGYAVCIFNPEELGACVPGDLEESLVNYAWEAIESLSRVNTKEEE